MKIVVVGTGYVGLVTGAGFSEFGNDVICVDIDEERIAALGRGELPFHEPNLAPLVCRNLADGRLAFTTDTAAAVADADVIFLAVGTPASGTGAADLRFLDAAARDIGRGLTGFAVIATKSTVPVGTADRVRAMVREHTGHDFAVASNPEFLKEGDAVSDFMKPSRVVIGVEDARAEKVLRNLYAPFMRASNRIHVMDIRSAELSKYAANAMLATRISLMNQLAVLAEHVGADIERVRSAVGADPRIGPKFLFPGTGFGGSCFPKDLSALYRMGQELGLELDLIHAVREVNERQKRLLADRMRGHFHGNLRGRRIGVWGLAFKPGTDDIREAPALVLMDQLLADGAEVVAYDPAARANIAARYGRAVRLPDNMYDVADGSDALLLMTEWHQFRSPNFKRLRACMRTPVLGDGRNIWSPDEVRSLGFFYYGIGRGAAAAPV